jgi:hypothetical protein
VDRRGPGRQGRDDHGAADRLRQDDASGAAQDRSQPENHRPGQGHSAGAAGASPAPTSRPGEAGEAWIDTGYVFTSPLGAPLNPDYLTRRFRQLVTRSGLPPVRLHDLRHGAASLAHAAGADLKTVREQLGHTSIVLTADTYTSVLMQLHFKTAEATARLVLAAAAQNPGRRYRARPMSGPPTSAATGQVTRPEPLRPRRKHRQRAARKRRARMAHT